MARCEWAHSYPMVVSHESLQGTYAPVCTAGVWHLATQTDLSAAQLRGGQLAAVDADMSSLGCTAVAVSALAEPERHQLLTDLQHLHNETRILDDQHYVRYTLTVGVLLLTSRACRSAVRNCSL